MKNQLQIFNNSQFGEVRIIEVDGKPHFVGSDVAKALGYEKPRNALQRHCKGTLKRGILTNGGKQQMSIIPEGDLYRLIINSRLPEAEKFESWVFDEVLPSIRKTGEYQTPSRKEELQAKRVEVMLSNARTRQAKLLMQLSADIKVPEYQEVLKGRAAEILTGEKLLPVSMRKTYSAKEIGNMLGVSANMVGRTANQNQLKVAEYGQVFYDKAEHSDKQVETWRYYDSVVPVLKRILGVQEVA